MHLTNAEVQALQAGDGGWVGIYTEHMGYFYAHRTDLEELRYHKNDDAWNEAVGDCWNDPVEE